jgi:hypothetical protein
MDCLAIGLLYRSSLLISIYPLSTRLRRDPIFFFVFYTFFFLVIPWSYVPRVDGVVSLMGMD